MANHFYDAEHNRYDDDSIPEKFTPVAIAKRSKDPIVQCNKEPCTVHLDYIDNGYTEVGIKNLCKRFGNVVSVRLNKYNNNGTVLYESYT